MYFIFYFWLAFLHVFKMLKLQFEVLSLPGFLRLNTVIIKIFARWLSLWCSLLIALQACWLGSSLRDICSLCAKEKYRGFNWLKIRDSRGYRVRGRSQVDSVL